MRICIVAAIGSKRQLGINGRIPWHIPAELQNFKKLTMGHTLIMGRKTHQSIGRLLPGRKTIVLTRDKSLVADNQSFFVAHNREEAIEISQRIEDGDVFVCGGAEVYSTFLEDVRRLYLTVVDFDGEADVFFPPYEHMNWRCIDSKVGDFQKGQPTWAVKTLVRS